MSTASEQGHVPPEAYDARAAMAAGYRSWDTASLREVLAETERELRARSMSAPNRRHTELRAEVLKGIISGRDGDRLDSG